MRILATLYDKNDVECSTFWLNGASELKDPVCAIQDCVENLGFCYPYCPHHLEEMFHVEVRPSKIHQNGLFATQDFPAQSPVVPFGGEIVPNSRELDKRYSSRGTNDCTASYTLKTEG